eukprot:3941929-Rhodomonas_salina.2
MIARRRAGYVGSVPPPQSVSSFWNHDVGRTPGPKKAAPLPGAHEKGSATQIGKGSQDSSNSYSNRKESQRLKLEKGPAQDTEDLPNVNYHRG